jgi:hypothetical protein
VKNISTFSGGFANTPQFPFMNCVVQFEVGHQALVQDQPLKRFAVVGLDQQLSAEIETVQVSNFHR